MTDSETPNHGLATPEPGRADWHEPLNENFEDLDREVLLKGAHDDRPDDPEDGTWFLSTDRNWLSYYDGSEWGVVGGVGTEADPVPGTTSAEAADTGELRVNDPDDRLTDVSPLAVRHHSEHGPVFAAQNHDDEGSNADRKCKFWFYNDDGSSRLAEFSPAEVKPVGDGKGAEWSSYLRGLRLSHSGETCLKWLNVVQSAEATEHPDLDRDYYFPEVEFRSNKRFNVEAATGEPTRVGFVPGESDTTQHLTWVDYEDGDAFEVRHDQAADHWTLFDDRIDRAVARYWLTEATWNWYGTTHEGVVWGSGSAADRPDEPEEGQRFFDSELGQPVWYDGEAWVDASGDPV